MLAWKQSILVAIQKPVSFSSIKLLSTSKTSCQTTVQSNYYEILDVPKSATQKEIREAYIKKSKEVRTFRNVIVKCTSKQGEAFENISAKASKNFR